MHSKHGVILSCTFRIPSDGDEWTETLFEGMRYGFLEPFDVLSIEKPEPRQKEIWEWIRRETNIMPVTGS